LERPALNQLLEDIKTGRIDCVVVYKVDRLSRSLLDFSRIMEIFDKHGVSFVSVTQQFNTTHSMGRLDTLMLLVEEIGDHFRSNPLSSYPGARCTNVEMVSNDIPVLRTM
jgi:DNA invertase Pin-like site-specific DNA recombinase